jgi:hypothetical protein
MERRGEERGREVGKALDGGFDPQSGDGDGKQRQCGRHWGRGGGGRVGGMGREVERGQEVGIQL